MNYEMSFDSQNGQIVYLTEQPCTLEWTVPATDELIKLYGQNYDLFQIGQIKTKRKIFEQVVPELAKKGYFYSAAQCENKWKSLKRSYLNKFERGAARRTHNKSRFFDKEVEEVLKKERPSLKRELEMFSVNLNTPPGFTNTEEIGDIDYQEMDENLVNKVLQDSEAELIHKRIGGDENNIEYVYSPDRGEDHNYSVKSPHSSKCSQEIESLKYTIKSYLDANMQLMKSSNLTNERILLYLTNQERHYESELKIKRQKLDKQTEIVQQLKIQNTLIDKLIQKLDQRKLKI